MTNNLTNNDGADAGSGPALLASDSSDEATEHADQATDHADEATDRPDEITNLPDGDPALSDDDTEIDDDASVENDVQGSGAVSGGFGFAGLALAIVSLTTNWTSGVVVSHGQYVDEIHAPSSGLTAQQQLDMYANGWHTQGLWALAFAVVAVLFGAGGLLLPGFLRGGDTPGWARASATGAFIVGLVGVLLALLTITGVFGGHLTAPTS
ncbi:MAG TPA: hypothetical protein VMU95_32950 [Trebonia sp.]|nr:hypothetical protein [Trebonia sp.]